MISFIFLKYYKYIIVDNVQSLGMYNDVIINISDFVYLIIEPSLAVAENNNGVAMNPKLRNKSLRIILNKYKEQKDAAIIGKLEEYIGRPIFTKIPKNYIAANKSFEKGVTIDEINPELDVTKAYEKLAKYMIDSDT